MKNIRMIIISFFSILLLIAAYILCKSLNTSFPIISISNQLSYNNISVMMNAQLLITSLLCSYCYGIIIGQIFLLFNVIFIEISIINNLKNKTKQLKYYLIFTLSILFLVVCCSTSIFSLIKGIDYIEYLSYLPIMQKPFPFNNMLEYRNSFLYMFDITMKLNIFFIFVLIIVLLSFKMNNLKKEENNEN